MAERKQIDWEAIEREYRAGQLSNVEIGKQFDVTEGAIRKRAKRDEWKKDLAAKVRKGVREKLVRDEVRIPNATDKEIEEAAIARGASVVKLHQKSIQYSQEMVSVLRDQLKEAATSRGEIEETITNETKEDNDTRRRNMMLRAVSLPTHAGILRDLSVAQKNLIPLERQAYNLDENGVRPDAIDEIAIVAVYPEAKG